MKKKLLQHMNWPVIESIIYSEEDNPHVVLGKTLVSTGTIFQTFQPQALRVSLIYSDTNSKVEMEKMEEEGYFAIFVTHKKISRYSYLVENEDGTEEEIFDPYDFQPVISQLDVEKIETGKNQELYKVLGAHDYRIKNIDGVAFTVWAPNVCRVSVVGDFNNWDGRRHQMRRAYNSGVFEIFIPGLENKARYKFEIKLKNSLTYLKGDPYAFEVDSNDDNVCLVHVEKNPFQWNDTNWINERKKFKPAVSPLNILEVNFDLFQNAKGICSCKEITNDFIAYVKKMNYTHIQCHVLMAHKNVENENVISNYYALDSSYGKLEDVQYFVDACHQAGIGVLLDWNATGFSRELHSLIGFDGTALYEHENNLQGDNYKRDMKLFNYARHEVSGFLISNVLYWINILHIDGICLKRMGEMLYLDYGKTYGEWIPNVYGGNENIDAIQFLKDLNATLKSKNVGLITIADDVTKFPNVTEPLKSDGLGFDYKWNCNWSTDMLGFFAKDPLYRKNVYNEFTFSMLYAYSEQYILGFSDRELIQARQTFIDRMYGDHDSKLSNLKSMYTYMFLHPGKKMMFLDYNPFTGKAWADLDTKSILDDSDVKKITLFTKELHQLYVDQPALWIKDHKAEGFTWVNSVAKEDCMFSFVRSGSKKEDLLFVVCNFSSKPLEKKTIGVPCAGKYKEIFSTDMKCFGGTKEKVSRKKTAKNKKVDGMKYAMNIDLPALSISIFKYEK